MKWYGLIDMFKPSPCVACGVYTYLFYWLCRLDTYNKHGLGWYPHTAGHSPPTPPVAHTQDTFGDGDTRSLDSIGPICYLWSEDYAITRTPLFPDPQAMGSPSRLSLRRYYARPNQTSKPAADHYLSHAYVSHVASGLE